MILINSFSNPLNVLAIAVPLSLITVWWFYKRKSPGFLLTRNVGKQFESSPAMRQLKIISFDEEGLYGTSELGATLTKWAAFIEAAESKDDLFLFTSNKFSHFIPKRFFSPAQLNQA